jgi:hypothetical protein
MFDLSRKRGERLCTAEWLDDWEQMVLTKWGEPRAVKPAVRREGNVVWLPSWHSWRFTWSDEER